jgi:6-pyruvoyltetrahydropterin/6-carboxytetrahydropterin synthase
MRKALSPTASFANVWPAKYIQFMPFEIRTVRTFSAAHQLRLYDGSIEPLHGHNWRVEVAVSAAQLDAIGVVMDFHELERLLDEIISPMHNRHLNELPAFAKLNPSAENVALHIAMSLHLPDGIRLQRVQVWETPENAAVYRP